MVNEPPTDGLFEEPLAVHDPKHWAAGVPGVVRSLAYSQTQMGPRRSLLTLARVNQKHGFDCPGCAWPEPDKRKLAEFCENGAKAVAEEATTRRVTRAFFASHSVDQLAGRTDYWLGQQGRLTEPMVKRSGADHYVPISWEEAYDLIAQELNGLKSPDEAAFYTSGRCSNEAAFVYQLFARAYGTNNLPDCSNMCHESSGEALSQTIGVGKGSVSLDDMSRRISSSSLDRIPGRTTRGCWARSKRPRRPGRSIVCINPLPEAGLLRFKNPQRINGVVGRGTELCDQFLQIRVNGDLALFQALNRKLLEAEDAAPGTVLDHDFISQHTDDFWEFAAHIRDLSWDEVRDATGLDMAEIDELALRVRRAERIVVCWAMGLTQHKNSVATIREIVNFLMLRGNLGRPGAGVCPVRGHSNVQGDRTMGIWEKPPSSWLDALRDEFGFDPPRRHGFDVVRTIQAMRDGQVKVFICLGGNFAAATPDTEATISALRTCRLTVQVSTKLNRSHAVTGETALILPTLGRTEVDEQPAGPQFVTVEDSMSVVHASRGTLPPASPALRSEVRIVCEMAHRTLGDRVTVPWESLAADYSLIRERIERVVPGCHDYRVLVARPGGSSWTIRYETGGSFLRQQGKATSPLIGCMCCECHQDGYYCKQSAPTISSTPRFMGWRTSTGASKAGDGWCSSHQRTSPTLACSMASRWISSVSGMTVPSGGRLNFASSPTPRLAAALLRITRRRMYLSRWTARQTSATPPRQSRSSCAWSPRVSRRNPPALRPTVGCARDWDGGRHEHN